MRRPTRDLLRAAAFWLAAVSLLTFGACYAIVAWSHPELTDREVLILMWEAIT